MHFFSSLVPHIKYAALHMPLEAFVFFGSLFEEIVSPIPSALIMGLAGSVASLQGEALWYLLLLSAIGNTGKTLGAWFYYFLGDKLEDLLIPKATKWFGVTHDDLQGIGRRFVGHHWKDGGVLFLLRLLPPVPTTPISIAAGIIKMDFRVFLVATYFGNFFKDLIYLYVGYAGLIKLRALSYNVDTMKLGFNIVLVVVVGWLLFVLYTERGRGRVLYHQFCERLAHWFHKR